MDTQGSSAMTSNTNRFTPTTLTLGDLHVAALQIDVKEAEAKLAEMKKATALRWNEFEASVSAATVRVRRSLDAAKG